MKVKTIVIGGSIFAAAYLTAIASFTYLAEVYMPKEQPSPIVI
ncbi:unnamed protein product, partial [marine sediment metagenome]